MSSSPGLLKKRKFNKTNQISKRFQKKIRNLMESNGAVSTFSKLNSLAWDLSSLAFINTAPFTCLFGKLKLPLLLFTGDVGVAMLSSDV
jgi:hypothetical protein